MPKGNETSFGNPVFPKQPFDDLEIEDSGQIDSFAIPLPIPVSQFTSSHRIDIWRILKNRLRLIGFIREAPCLEGTLPIHNTLSEPHKLVKHAERNTSDET